MNYQKIYDSLILKRKSSPPKNGEYSEKHHIKPRCIGGDDSKENIVSLTAREHFIAHYLLAKIYGGSLWVPVYLMSNAKSNSAKGYAGKSKTYEILKAKYIEWAKTANKGIGNPFHGRKHSKETIEKFKSRTFPSGPDHHDFGRIKDGNFGWVISMINSYKPNEKEIDRSKINQIHKAVGLFCRFDEYKNTYVRKKPNELKRLKNYYLAMSMGVKNRERDISGEKNPNYGNSKVAGKNNGRFISTKYRWINKKNPLNEVVCDRFTSYTNHGMNKSGVSQCINGKRESLKDWYFGGVAYEH